jgi:phage gp29-like protein
MGIFDILKKPQPIKEETKNKEHVVKVTPQPLQRLKLDIQRWRNAVLTAESVLNPYRIELQRNYNEIAINAHIKACVERRKNLTLLRDFDFYKGEEEVELKNKKMVLDVIEESLNAIFYGYSLLQIEDIVDGMGSVCLIPRERIIPERQTITTSTQYDANGVKFYDEQYKDWLIWMPTRSESSNTTCGLGLFNVLAPYEIYIRNANTAWSEYQQIYGVPLRIGKTNTREKLMRDNMSQMMADMGRSGWAVVDIDDQIEMVDGGKGGGASDNFLGLINYCEKVISKVILGHADALDSTPGKLGAETSVDKALSETQQKDGLYIEHLLNEKVFPQFAKLGLKEFDGLRIEFENNHDENLEKINEAEILNKVLNNYLIAYQMGLQPDAKQVSEMLGIELTNNEEKIKESIQNRLNDLY